MASASKNRPPRIAAAACCDRSVPAFNESAATRRKNFLTKKKRILLPSCPATDVQHAGRATHHRVANHLRRSVECSDHQVESAVAIDRRQRKRNKTTGAGTRRAGLP